MTSDIKNTEDKGGNEEEEKAPKKKKKNRNKMGRLLVNVSYCHYPVVRTCAKMNKIKVTYQEEEDWDIYWQDGAV